MQIGHLTLFIKRFPGWLILENSTAFNSFMWLRHRLILSLGKCDYTPTHPSSSLTHTHIFPKSLNGFGLDPDHYLLKGIV